MSSLSNNAGFVVAFIFFGCGVSLMLLANFLLYIMIGRVNVKLPEEQRIGYFWFDLGKNIRVLREYRRLYPDSALGILAVILFFVSIAFVIAFAWKFGFFNFSHLKPYQP